MNKHLQIFIAGLRKVGKEVSIMLAEFARIALAIATVALVILGIYWSLLVIFTWHMPVNPFEKYAGAIGAIFLLGILIAKIYEIGKKERLPPEDAQTKTGETNS